MTRRIIHSIFQCDFTAFPTHIPTMKTVDRFLSGLSNFVISLIEKSMKDSTAMSDGILIDSASMVARVQACAKCAQEYAAEGA
jgi:hypothetical protein